MRIDITRQIRCGASFPLVPTPVYTGSALPIEVVGVPRLRGNSEVVGVRVAITNADGVTVTVGLEPRGDGSWCANFAAANFAAFGRVDNGVIVYLELLDIDAVATERIASGILDIIAGTPDARPGDPDAHYVAKGDDQFVKTAIVDGVQHYKRIVVTYVERMGDWGFDLEGDYILTDAGQFVPANTQEGE